MKTRTSCIRTKKQSWHCTSPEQDQDSQNSSMHGKGSLHAMPFAKEQLIVDICWELLRQHNCPDLWIGPLPPRRKGGQKRATDALLWEQPQIVPALSQRRMSWPQDVPWYHQVPASPCSRQKKNFRCPIPPVEKYFLSFCCPIPPAEVHFLCPIPPAERHFPFCLCI